MLVFISVLYQQKCPFPYAVFPADTLNNDHNYSVISTNTLFIFTLLPFLCSAAAWCVNELSA